MNFSTCSARAAATRATVKRAARRFCDSGPSETYHDPRNGRDGAYGRCSPGERIAICWLRSTGGDFLINGLRNRDLQVLLYAQAAASAAQKRRRSAAISRKLRMLRAHGLIQKVPRTHRYQVSAEGRSILLSVLTTARTSLLQLNQLAEKAA